GKTGGRLTVESSFCVFSLHLAAFIYIYTPALSQKAASPGPVYFKLHSFPKFFINKHLQIPIFIGFIYFVW
ncbi:MAG: hypothetical protein KDI01_04925, partial [Halioglobus sp.]|nr:hypothetical protein [Halioglobus sp.]